MDGKYAWVICVMAFFAQACSCGFYISFGTLFVAIVEDYKTTETKAALVGSISYSLCLLFGCISSPLCTRFGCRQVAAVGAALISLGLVLSSFVKSIEMLYFTFGIVFSTGASAAFFSSLLVLAENFDKNYALAIGIASSGTGAGGFAFATITEKSLELFGLTRTFRYLAGIGVILMIGALIYGPSRVVPSTRQNEKKKRKMLDFSVWKNGAFVIWSIIVCILFFVYYVPYVHLVNLAINISISKTKAASLLGYVSIASCIGKIAFGKIADHPRINRLYLIQFSLLVVSICHTLCPLSRSYETLAVYCFVYGAFDGCFNSLLAVIVGDIVGKENLHNAIGAMYLLSSTFLMFGPPLAGYLYSSSGSYDSSFFIGGGAVAFASCLMFLIPWFIPKDPGDAKLLLIKGEQESGTSNEPKTLDKKESWVTYDSGIDLTLKDNSIYTSNLDDVSNSTVGSHKKRPRARKLSNLFERMRAPKKELIPVNIMNSFAVSTLDLNSNDDELVVVEKISIV